MPRPPRPLPALVVALAAALALSAGLAPARAETPAMARGTIWDHPVTAGAAIFTSSITTLKPSSALRLTVGIESGQTDSTLVLRVSDGTTTRDLVLNSATALTAGSLYTFTIGVSRVSSNGAAALTYNFETGSSTVLAYFDVQEVQFP